MEAYLAIAYLAVALGAGIGWHDERRLDAREAFPALSGVVTGMMWPMGLLILAGEALGTYAARIAKRNQDRKSVAAN